MCPLRAHIQLVITMNRNANSSIIWKLWIIMEIWTYYVNAANYLLIDLVWISVTLKYWYARITFKVRNLKIKEFLITWITSLFEIKRKFKILRTVLNKVSPKAEIYNIVEDTVNVWCAFGRSFIYVVGQLYFWQ